MHISTYAYLSTFPAKAYRSIILCFVISACVCKRSTKMLYSNFWTCATSAIVTKAKNRIKWFASTGRISFRWAAWWSGWHAWYPLSSRCLWRISRTLVRRGSDPERTSGIADWPTTCSHCALSVDSVCSSGAARAARSTAGSRGTGRNANDSRRSRLRPGRESGGDETHSIEVHVSAGLSPSLALSPGLDLWWNQRGSALYFWLNQRGSIKT